MQWSRSTKQYYFSNVWWVHARILSRSNCFHISQGSHQTCTRADAEGMVFVPTEDAVSDAVSGAVGVLCLSLGDCSAYGKKYTKNSILLCHTHLNWWIGFRCFTKLTVPVSAEIQCCSFIMQFIAKVFNCHMPVLWNEDTQRIAFSLGFIIIKKVCILLQCAVLWEDGFSTCHLMKVDTCLNFKSTWSETCNPFCL